MILGSIILLIGILIICLYDAGSSFIFYHDIEEESEIIKNEYKKHLAILYIYKLMKNCEHFENKEPSYDPLIGCDGEPHSNEFLYTLMKESEDKEDYKKAVIYRDELIKRGVLNNIKIR